MTEIRTRRIAAQTTETIQVHEQDGRPIGLTVDANSPMTIVGSRAQVDRHYRQHKVALWLKACGRKAVLFYEDNGKKRQKTFKVERVIHGST